MNPGCGECEDAEAEDDHRGRDSHVCRAKAHSDGTFPVDRVMKITAMMSWTIRMPMATRPCRDSISPFLSSAFTAKTVLEKLRAKATKAEVARSSPANM